MGKVFREDETRQGNTSKGANPADVENKIELMHVFLEKNPKA